MRIQSINIHSIGGIEDLSLAFNDSFNIICGPNGVGKTTILECISHSFSHQQSSFIRRNANNDKGNWTLTASSAGNSINISVEKKYFHPNEDKQDKRDYVHQNYAEEMIVFKTNRHFDYIPVTAITQDQKDQDSMSASINGVSYGHSKSWFIGRFMWSAHGDVLNDIQKRNLETAQSLFGALDPSVSYSRVKIETFDIILKTNDGSEIYFEYLSSGYKSVLFVLLALIKEIEFRFTEPNILVEDFDGVIIIDELDLHLHPQWQAKLIIFLKKLLPKAQIIVSTHSPHMIQAADSNEIIPLGFSSEGKVELRDVSSGVYGFQGWSVEEILTDVMGLDATYSQTYTDAMASFEKAIDADNLEEAKKAFDVLDEMLHPNNHLRKLLKFQLASLGEGSV